MSFFTIAFSQLFHVFNMRDDHSNIFKNDISKNLYVWIALIICSLLMYMTLMFESIKNIMKLEYLSFVEWQVVMMFSILPLIVIQLFLEVKKFFNPSNT
jgi:P-type Ca2+ transporter type 2C